MSEEDPLYCRIGAWHEKQDETHTEAPIIIMGPISIIDCKTVFLPRQRLLKTIDPEGSRPLLDVRDEVEALAEHYMAILTHVGVISP